jgi:cytoskeletal protein CcmA (bactofilin family)
MAEVSSGGQGQDKKTLVEEGTSFKGSASSTCPIEVRGRIEGEVQAPSLAISPSGAVHGRVRVGTVTSEGEIAGEFDAESVELSGTVCDDTVIRTKSLRVQLSGGDGKLRVLFGTCELNVGDDPEQTSGSLKAKSDAPKAGPPVDSGASSGGQ